MKLWMYVKMNKINWIKTRFNKKQSSHLFRYCLNIHGTVESTLREKLVDLSTPADFAMLARTWIQSSPCKSILRTCRQKVKTNVKQNTYPEVNTSHLGNLFLLESCGRSLVSEHTVTWHLHVSETKSKTYRTKSLLVNAALEMKKNTA